MGTNYYRVLKIEEMVKRRNVLLEKIKQLPLSPSDIEMRFRTVGSDAEYLWECSSPWEDFIEGSSVHLGKRSWGWKFMWNFHNNKYYSDKKSLLYFIRGGRVFDEYGDEMDPDEFIRMALEWGQPDGWDTETYYKVNPRGYDFSRFYDRYVDGLRISSSTDFS